MYEKVSGDLENVKTLNELNNPGCEAAAAVEVYINNPVGVQGRLLA
jgi:hypothetical protein